MRAEIALSKTRKIEENVSGLKRSNDEVLREIRKLDREADIYKRSAHRARETIS